MPDGIHPNTDTILAQKTHTFSHTTGRWQTFPTVNFTLPVALNVTAGTKYWLVYQTTYTALKHGSGNDASYGQLGSFCNDSSNGYYGSKNGTIATTISMAALKTAAAYTYGGHGVRATFTADPAYGVAAMELFTGEGLKYWKNLNYQFSTPAGSTMSMVIKDTNASGAVLATPASPPFDLSFLAKSKKRLFFEINFRKTAASVSPELRSLNVYWQNEAAKPISWQNLRYISANDAIDVLGTGFVLLSELALRGGTTSV